MPTSRDAGIATISSTVGVIIIENDQVSQGPTPSQVGESVAPWPFRNPQTRIQYGWVRAAKGVCHRAGHRLPSLLLDVGMI